MSDPQEAATPSDPHSAEAEEREAWAAFVAGHASRDAEVAELKKRVRNLLGEQVAGIAFMNQRDELAAEVAELKAKIAESQAIVAELLDPDPCNWDHNHSCQAHGFYYIPQGETCPNERGRQYLAASSPVEGGN